MPVPSRPRLRAALLAVAVLPLTAAGCATAQAPSDAPPSDPPETGRVASIDAGDPFRLALGETHREDGHTVTFVEVVEDSRCPEGVACVWSGRAKIRVEVDGEPFVLTVPYGGMEDDESPMIEWGEIQVVVTGLEPYPGSEAAEAGAPVEAVLITRPSTV
jgi:hypothetical protein